MLVTSPIPSVTPPLPTTTTTTDITSVPLQAAEVTVFNVSRTTEWHHLKGLRVPKTPQKVYACGICGMHKSSKHFHNELHVARYVFLKWQKQPDTLSTFQATLRGNGTALFLRYPRRSGLPQFKQRIQLLLLPPLPQQLSLLSLTYAVTYSIIFSNIPYFGNCSRKKTFANRLH